MGEGGDLVRKATADAVAAAVQNMSMRIQNMPTFVSLGQLSADQKTVTLIDGTSWKVIIQGKITGSVNRVTRLNSTTYLMQGSNQGLIQSDSSKDLAYILGNSIDDGTPGIAKVGDSTFYVLSLPTVPLPKPVQLEALTDITNNGKHLTQVILSSNTAGSPNPQIEVTVAAFKNISLASGNASTVSPVSMDIPITLPPDELVHSETGPATWQEVTVADELGIYSYCKTIDGKERVCVDVSFVTTQEVPVGAGGSHFSSNSSFVYLKGVCPELATVESVEVIPWTNLITFPPPFIEFFPGDIQNGSGFCLMPFRSVSGVTAIKLLELATNNFTSAPVQEVGRSTPALTNNTALSSSLNDPIRIVTDTMSLFMQDINSQISATEFSLFDFRRQIRAVDSGKFYRLQTLDGGVIQVDLVSYDPAKGTVSSLKTIKGKTAGINAVAFAIVNGIANVSS